MEGGRQEGRGHDLFPTKTLKAKIERAGVSSRCFEDVLRKVRRIAFWEIPKSDLSTRRRKLQRGDRGAVSGRWLDIIDIFLQEGRWL